MTMSCYSHAGAEFITGNKVFFTIQIVAFYLLLLGTCANSSLCSCPSCEQNDKVQRCACCVYRQLGKRSQTFYSHPSDFPRVEVNLDSEPWTNVKATEASSNEEDNGHFDELSPGQDKPYLHNSDIDSNRTPKGDDKDGIFFARDTTVPTVTKGKGRGFNSFPFSWNYSSDRLIVRRLTLRFV